MRGGHLPCSEGRTGGLAGRNLFVGSFGISLGWIGRGWLKVNPPLGSMKETCLAGEVGRSERKIYFQD